MFLVVDSITSQHWIPFWLHKRLESQPGQEGKKAQAAKSMASDQSLNPEMFIAYFASPCVGRMAELMEPAGTGKVKVGPADVTNARNFILLT